MGSTATITGKTGPGLTVTAISLSDVRSFLFNLSPSSVLKVTLNGGEVRDFDLGATTTITATISGGIMALTISQ
jgi:hypothetical protein